MRLLVLIALLSGTWSQQLSEYNPVKRIYVCPPNFIRQGHRCYFFSKDATTWQEALYNCRERHSHIAVIKTRNQDKLIRSFLSQKSIDPVERWLGGVYDWAKMSWKWAASGKPLSYSGFVNSDNRTNKESLRWHCLTMDPSLNFGWNSRGCFEKKHYMCHTKLKIVTNKGMKKLKQHYKVDKSNRLNEIPVPSVPEYANNRIPLKSSIPMRIEINESLNDQAMFAFAPKELRKVKKNRKRKERKIHAIRLANGTVLQIPKRRNNSKRRKPKPDDMGKPTLIRNIRWRTYKKKDKMADPLLPVPIVEEFNYIKG